MAERKVYIGSVGPFLYDDEEPIGDADFVGQNQGAVVTNGGLVAGSGTSADITLPEYGIEYAGIKTTIGGAATEAFTISGILASDTPMVVMASPGASPVTIISVSIAADTLTVTFSGDPSNDHTFYYMIARAT